MEKRSQTGSKAEFAFVRVPLPVSPRNFSLAANAPEMAARDMVRRTPKVRTLPENNTALTPPLRISLAWIIKNSDGKLMREFTAGLVSGICGYHVLL